jgi:hypothetical protein
MSILEVPRSSTMASEATTVATTPQQVASPTATVVDLAAALERKVKDKDATPSPSTHSQSEPEGEGNKEGCEFKISQRKKWSLLAVFSLAMFVDSESSTLHVWDSC